MDEKFVKALCLAYGNYRAAITAWDAEAADAASVVGTGKALLTLQEALNIEVADPEQVRVAIDMARNDYINR